MLYMGMTKNTILPSVVLCFLALVIQACQVPVSLGDQEAKNRISKPSTGLVPSEPGLNESLSHLRLTKLSGYQLPTATNLKAYVGTGWNQGGQGSCVGFASAIMKTVLEHENRGWTTFDYDHRFSPAWVYNQLNGGLDEGSSLYMAMNLLKTKGICLESDMFYNEHDFVTQPSWLAVTHAAAYKLSDFSSIDPSETTRIKEYLATGYPLVCGLPVYPDFDDLTETNPVYDGIWGEVRSYHALALVGYDDTQGSRGAFLVRNSWDGAPGWGVDGGYGWVDYDLFAKHAFDVYVTRDRVSPNPASSWNMDFSTSDSVKDWATSTLKSTYRFEVAGGRFLQTDGTSSNYVDTMSSAKSVSLGASARKVTFVYTMHVGPGVSYSHQNDNQPNIASILSFPDQGWAFNVQVSDWDWANSKHYYHAFNSWGPANRGYRLYENYTNTTHSTDVSGKGWTFGEGANDQDYWVKIELDRAAGTLTAFTLRTVGGPWTQVGLPYTPIETAYLVSALFSSATLNFAVGFGTYATCGGITRVQVDVQ